VLKTVSYDIFVEIVMLIIQDSGWKVQKNRMSFFLPGMPKQKKISRKQDRSTFSYYVGCISHTHILSIVYSHMHHLLSLNTDRQHSWSTHTRLNLLFLSITLGSAEACVNEPELQISMCIVNKMIVQWCAVNNNLNHSQIMCHTFEIMHFFSSRYVCISKG